MSVEPRINKPQNRLSAKDLIKLLHGEASGRREVSKEEACERRSLYSQVNNFQSPLTQPAADVLCTKSQPTHQVSSPTHPSVASRHTSAGHTPAAQQMPRHAAADPLQQVEVPAELVAVVSSTTTADPHSHSSPSSEPRGDPPLSTLVSTQPPSTLLPTDPLQTTSHRPTPAAVPASTEPLPHCTEPVLVTPHTCTATSHHHPGPPSVTHHPAANAASHSATHDSLPSAGAVEPPNHAAITLIPAATTTTEFEPPAPSSPLPRPTELIQQRSELIPPVANTTTLHTPNTHGTPAPHAYSRLSPTPSDSQHNAESGTHNVVQAEDCHVAQPELSNLGTTVQLADGDPQSHGSPVSYHHKQPIPDDSGNLHLEQSQPTLLPVVGGAEGESLMRIDPCLSQHPQQQLYPPPPAPHQQCNRALAQPAVPSTVVRTEGTKLTHFDPSGLPVPVGQGRTTRSAPPPLPPTPPSFTDAPASPTSPSTPVNAESPQQLGVELYRSERPPSVPIHTPLQAGYDPSVTTNRENSASGMQEVTALQQQQEGLQSVNSQQTQQHTHHQPFLLSGWSTPPAANTGEQNGRYSSGDITHHHTLSHQNTAGSGATVVGSGCHPPRRHNSAALSTGISCIQQQEQLTTGELPEGRQCYASSPQPPSVVQYGGVPVCSVPGHVLGQHSQHAPPLELLQYGRDNTDNTTNQAVDGSRTGVQLQTTPAAAIVVQPTGSSTALSRPSTRLRSSPSPNNSHHQSPITVMPRNMSSPTAPSQIMEDFLIDVSGNSSTMAYGGHGSGSRVPAAVATKASTAGTSKTRKELKEGHQHQQPPPSPQQPQAQDTTATPKKKKHRKQPVPHNHTDTPQKPATSRQVQESPQYQQEIQPDHPFSPPSPLPHQSSTPFADVTVLYLSGSDVNSEPEPVYVSAAESVHTVDESDCSDYDQLLANPKLVKQRNPSSKDCDYRTPCGAQQHPTAQQWGTAGNKGQQQPAAGGGGRHNSTKQQRQMHTHSTPQKSHKHSRQDPCTGGVVVRHDHDDDDVFYDAIDHQQPTTSEHADMFYSSPKNKSTNIHCNHKQGMVMVRASSKSSSGKTTNSTCSSSSEAKRMYDELDTLQQQQIKDGTLTTAVHSQALDQLWERFQQAEQRRKQEKRDKKRYKKKLRELMRNTPDPSTPLTGSSFPSPLPRHSKKQNNSAGHGPTRGAGNMLSISPLPKRTTKRTTATTMEHNSCSDTDDDAFMNN